MARRPLKGRPPEELLLIVDVAVALVPDGFEEEEEGVEPELVEVVDPEESVGTTDVLWLLW